MKLEKDKSNNADSIRKTLRVSFQDLLPTITGFGWQPPNTGKTFRLFRFSVYCAGLPLPSQCLLDLPAIALFLCLL